MDGKVVRSGLATVVDMILMIQKINVTAGTLFNSAVPPLLVMSSTS
jgi:hypothetical protein